MSTTVTPTLVPDQSPTNKPQTTHLEKKRWGILFAFSLYNAGVAMAWLTYSSTSQPSMDYFDINTSEYMFFSDSVLYMTFIFSYLGCFLATRIFKWSVLACAFLSAIGGWIRYIGGSNYGVAVTGQILIGIATAPQFGISSYLPDRWFPISERFLATTIAVYSNYVGWAFGYILPCIIVGDDKDKTRLNVLIQAIIMTIPAILGIFFVKEKPKVPPSYSAQVKLIDKSFWREMWDLLKMKQFVVCSIIFGLLIGVQFSVSTVSSIFMEPLGLTYIEQGVIGFCYVAVGLVAGFLSTVYISKQTVQNYDTPMKILLALSLAASVALGIVFLCIEEPGFALILICNCLMGIGLIGITPFLCVSVSEISFPVSESISTNAMSILAQAFSIAINNVVTLDFVGKGGFMALAILVFPCWVYGTFIYKTKYKKQEAETANQKELEASPTKSTIELRNSPSQEQDSPLYPLKGEEKQQEKAEKQEQNLEGNKENEVEAAL